MSRAFVFLTLSWLMAGSPCLADQPIVSFDVPALLEAKPIEPDSFRPGISSTSQKVVEVVIPVSTVINRLTDRNHISEFRFDVGWNQAVYPLIDYGPRTQTTAGIEGTIGVQKTDEASGKIELGISGQAPPLSSLNLKSDVGTKSSSQRSFQEIPQHQLLVASGTIDRGTGAFFRFHRSKTAALEGGKEIVLAFRVPNRWRNGLLKVRCLATGSRRVANLWKEPVMATQSFVIPIYSEGDIQSQDLAIDFVKAEQELRRSWISSQPKGQNNTTMFSIPNLFQSKKELPSNWLESMILSGDQRLLSGYKHQLSQEVAVAAGKFVQTRSNLKE